MEEFESEHCPVCHKIVDVNTNIKISEEMERNLGDLIYRPGDDVSTDLTEDQEKQRRELEQYLEENKAPEIELA